MTMVSARPAPRPPTAPGADGCGFVAVRCTAGTLRTSGGPVRLEARTPHATEHVTPRALFLKITAGAGAAKKAGSAWTGRKTTFATKTLRSWLATPRPPARGTAGHRDRLGHRPRPCPAASGVRHRGPRRGGDAVALQPHTDPWGTWLEWSPPAPLPEMFTDLLATCRSSLPHSVVICHDLGRWHDDGTVGSLSTTCSNTQRRALSGARRSGRRRRVERDTLVHAGCRVEFVGCTTSVADALLLGGEDSADSRSPISSLESTCRAVPRRHHEHSRCS